MQSWTSARFLCLWSVHGLINTHTHCKYVMSSSWNRLTEAFYGPRWVMRLWVSLRRRSPSQHQSGNPICRADASGIDVMCLWWQHYPRTRAIHDSGSPLNHVPTASLSFTTVLTHTDTQQPLSGPGAWQLGVECWLQLSQLQLLRPGKVRKCYVLTCGEKRSYKSDLTCDPQTEIWFYHVWTLQLSAIKDESAHVRLSV